MCMTQQGLQDLLCMADLREANLETKSILTQVRSMPSRGMGASRGLHWVNIRVGLTLCVCYYQPQSLSWWQQCILKNSSFRVMLNYCVGQLHIGYLLTKFFKFIRFIRILLYLLRTKDKYLSLRYLLND